MSGDVQPRKRKDKKKKKDELGVEEPRGTAAAFGEGDVFMHSQSGHGTGGHWCAKVIFFSLLAVLITLVGLIILENRGLTELEANSVESRYSGVLEGWIEDAPDNDHHDEHTLELKHHDEDDEDHGSELDHGDEGHDDDDEGHDDNDDDHDDNDENNDAEDESDEEDEIDNDNEEIDQEADDSEEADNVNADDDEDEQSQEENEGQNLDAANDEDDIEESSYSKYYKSNDKANEDDDDDDSLQKEDENDDNNIKRIDADDEEENDNIWEENKEEDDKTSDNDDDNSRENDDYLQNDAAYEDEEEHEDDEEEAEPVNVEIETIEREVSDDDAVSTEEPSPKDDDDDDQSQDVSEELSPNEDDSSLEEDDVEFLEPDELDELPIVEPITAPKGKPLPELGESRSTEKPQDTLADEEEYERHQEELRKEKEQASQGMWLKLTVGGALLVATHAVLRRATASRETETEEDEQDYREETPLSDRRMTLVSDPVPPPTVAPKAPEVPRPIEREVKRETPTIVQSSPSAKEEKEFDEEEIISKPIQQVKTPDTVDRELYSDEEDIDIEEEEEDEEEIEPPQAIPQQAVPQAPHTMADVTKEVTPEPDEDDDDVEIIDEEQLEEELEEEEISDVDDAELLSRLEEKYGRLPEPERPNQKDGGNSFEDEWPGEPADAFWSEHLEQAQRELRQGAWTAAVEKASAPSLRASARARYIAAQALDAAAEANKDNQLLSKAIAAYLDLLKLNEKLSDKKLLEVTNRTLDRIKFRGSYLSAEPVYKLLIRRFPNEPGYRNNLTISLLMANRADLAENVIKETLKLWPDDRIALAHHGFILKTLHNRLEEAVDAFAKALEGDAGSANQPRFYYHYGDALILLGRFEKAHEVHQRGATLGHFLSPSQRSLYNVDRLKSRPWWDVEQTPYTRLARALENSWKDILKEGEAAKALYEKEKEGLKERGEWSQLDLFVQGREVPNRCSRAPITCGIVKSEMAARGCRRGQIKFSMMAPGTHVRPHVGPTNCRLRMHLGLSNTKDTYLRVDRETRQWQTGKVLIFDDSFEHEVWHNGTDTRLVLIVDVWHPDLTPAERRQLPAI